MPALFPSTYKQVVKNMQDILAQLEILNSINDKVNSYDEKFDEINTNFTTINQSFEKINQELVTINASIEKLGDLTDFPYGSITELADLYIKEQGTWLVLCAFSRSLLIICWHSWISQ